MEKVGIIGGSGLYELDGMRPIRHVKVTTPFGDPSDDIVVGEWQGVEMVFLARHGRGHVLMPSEINYRANVYAFKQMGVRWMISISAVGSMREHLHPGDIVLVDQFFDATKKRVSTFFGNGMVAHVGMAEPVCTVLVDHIFETGKTLGVPVKKGGTYICIEGPQFSTKGESKIYRQWGVDVIGMTAMPEAKLAREAGMCYATIALVTDYDCWHETEEHVTIEQVVGVLHSNIEKAHELLTCVPTLPHVRPCTCRDSLRYAVITAADKIPQKVTENLAALLRED